MRTFAIGDLHGAHKALVQVLERAGFDRETDRLISLGDVSDYWPETYQCINELMAIPNHVPIAGNHDLWTRDYLVSGSQPSGWLMQGGEATTRSYRYAPLGTIQRHQTFFTKQILYFVDEEERLYVHGGFDPSRPIEDQGSDILAWDRKLIEVLYRFHQKKEDIPPLPYREVFVGHTPTQYFRLGPTPQRFGPLWALDTGVKMGAPLTIMNVETHEYWQSDPVRELYMTG